MNILKKYLRRIIIDAAGYGLIILSILTGWLPGPGGIPLFLAGLGLLSINNAWARRLLNYVKQNGVKLLDILFPDNPWIKALHDAIVILLLGIVTYLIVTANNIFAYSVSIVLVVLAVVDFFYNRKRWKTFVRNKQK